jgi:phenylalanyl-tRNA synthetase beta chain
MLVSLNWLKDFVDINVNSEKSFFNKVVVGFVEKMDKHPNADRLNVAEVNIGNETVQIVCGGVNLKEKVYVAVALPGSVLPGNFEIKKSVIRGIESNGMICHLSELGLAEDDGKHEISIIAKTTPGTPFVKTLKVKGMSPEELQELLTIKTAEVEKIEREDKHLQHVVTGKLIDFEKIPNTKFHHKGSIDIGGKIIQLVFGSVHVAEKGWILPIALPGAKLPGGEIKEAKIQGVLSQGMICADDELGIQNSPSGLTVFPEGTPLGKPISEILKLDDTIIEFDNKSLTHRPDLWGHYGIAREIAALTDTKLKPYAPKVVIPKNGESAKVEVKDFDLCKRFCSLVINNIKVEESPLWMKKRLKATGHGAHNNIVDVTNYVMTELGQPMHAFDKEYIKKGIVVRRAQKGEKITSLDGKERILTEEMGVVADHERAVAVAGIIGGENSEINEKTTSIILEAATWNPSIIRRTSTKLGIRTEAVQRFEKSLDPAWGELAILKAAELILKLCPSAKIAGPMTDIKKSTDKPVIIAFDTNKAQSKIGTEISQLEMKKILEKLEFKATVKSKGVLTVEVPSFRATKDVHNENDLVEEIARMYGYDNIPVLLPTLPTKLPIENLERFKKHRTRELFSYALGFDEIYNYSFYGLKELKNCGMLETNHIKLLNYLSEEQTHLRISLIPNLIKNLQLNAKYLDAVKIYEIGRTYQEIGQFMPLEEKKIGGAILSKGKSDQPFYEAKGAAESFFQKFNITVAVAKGITDLPYAHPIKSVSYLATNGETLAKVFMLHPGVVKNHDLEKYSIAMFEINFSEALKFEKVEKFCKKLPRFPNIEIDISVLIENTVEVETIKKAILDSDKTLVKSAELFDIYEGSNLEKNKKAIAYKVTLQSDEKTLTDEEMAQVQQKIFSNLEKLGGTIRGK